MSAKRITAIAFREIDIFCGFEPLPVFVDESNTCHRAIADIGHEMNEIFVILFLLRVENIERIKIF